MRQLRDHLLDSLLELSDSRPPQLVAELTQRLLDVDRDRARRLRKGEVFALAKLEGLLAALFAQLRLLDRALTLELLDLGLQCPLAHEEVLVAAEVVFTLPV